MAQLDYAMLAEFARADQAGLLTVVGGGFDRIQVSSLGLVHQMFLVVRFRLTDDEKLVNFEVKVVPPGEPQFELTVTGSATVSPTSRPVPGNFGTLSVIGLGLPIASPGSHRVQIYLEGDLVKELPFDVDVASQAAS